MAGEWEMDSLGELIDVKHGFAFKGEHIHDEPIGDVLLSPGNFALGGGFKDDKLKYYDGPVPKEFVLRDGDLLVTMTDLSKQADTLGFPYVLAVARLASVVDLVHCAAGKEAAWWTKDSSNFGDR